MLVRCWRISSRLRWLKWTLVISTGVMVGLFWSKSKVVEHSERLDSQPTQTTVGFIADQPKLAVILASMRTGSEFFGRMFGTNPNIFFPVEPITPMYHAMYGTYWNLQSDINFFSNGSRRVLPRKELDQVSDYLRNLLTCNFDGLPTEALAYGPVWVGQGCPSNTSAGYASCVARTSQTRCWRSGTVDYCGAKFGTESEERIQTCHRLLHIPERSEIRQIVPKNIVETFSNYQKCLNSTREQIRSACHTLFNDACQTKSLRIAKTVRASMASMEHLLESIPNFRVIHLIRDPRPVALSRMNYGTDRLIISIAAGNDDFTIVREAEMYCKIVVDDIRAKRLLEQKYPGRIYTLIYEDLASDNIRYMEEVYKFLDEPVHKDTYDWLETTFKGRKSRDIAIGWRKKMTTHVNDEIVKRCKKFYDMVGHDWPTK